MKYIIKVTCIGTDNNPNFAGVRKTWWCGKDSQNNILSTVFEDDCSDVFFATRRLAMVHGYATEKDAERGLAFLKKHHKEESEKWNFHVFEHEIVSVEV